MEVAEAAVAAAEVPVVAAVAKEEKIYMVIRLRRKVRLHRPAVLVLIQCMKTMMSTRVQRAGQERQIARYLSYLIFVTFFGAFLFVGSFLIFFSLSFVLFLFWLMVYEFRPGCKYILVGIFISFCFV